MEFQHKSVLLQECIEGLNIKKDGIYVDGTLGGAGHSSVILEYLSPKGKLIGIDRDKEALQASKKKLASYENFYPVHDNHANIFDILEDLHINGVDGILLDLGVSSYQLDEANRGFSYKQDAPLDMRMNQDDLLTAAMVVNEYQEEKLMNIFVSYGEEKFAKRIARKIAEKRKRKKIETTLELVEIIKSGIPAQALRERQHPAKRVFQAIRIEVNDELTRLKQAIRDSILSLKDKGRLAVITFHSLEDKIVKHTYEQMQGKCTCPPGLPVCVCGYQTHGTIITRKPIIASEKELEENPRARSAKLRIFERKLS